MRQKYSKLLVYLISISSLILIFAFAFLKTV